MGDDDHRGKGVPHVVEAGGTAPDFVRVQSEQIASLISALDRQSKLIDAMIAGAPVAAAGTTIAEIWSRYNASMAARPWWRTVVSMMKCPLEHFGAMVVNDLKRSAWVHYRDHIAAKRTTITGRVPAPATLNLELRRLKSLCTWAMGEELIARNPFQGIKTLKTGRRDTIVSDEGLTDLLRVSPPMLRAMILVAIDSGLRLGEVRTLEWDCLDLQTGRVTLTWDKTKTRTARKSRLSDRAIDAIRMLPRGLISPFVFVNSSTGKPYTYNRIWQWWRSASADADLEAAPGDRLPHFHDLRRSAVSRMLQLGLPLFTVMRNAGHQTASEAWRYTTTTDDDLDELKAVVDASILRGPRRGPERAAANAKPKKEHATKK